MLIAPITGW
jgi:hypothetical protein